MIRRPPRSTLSPSSAASDVYKRQVIANVHDELVVKSFVKENDKQFLTSGSKKFEDRILINEEADVFVWGVVTYVIHSVY